jgi:hypothetical protein
VNTLAVIMSASVREHSRRKLIFFFAGLSVAVTVILIAVTRDASAEAVFGPQSGLGNFVALGVLQLFALTATLAVSMGNIGQPFANGEALGVLVRPVARWQYVAGRFLGSTAVIAGLCLLMAIETQVVQLVATGDLSGTIWGHWGITTFNLIVVAAVTTLVSVFASVPILAAVAGFFANQITEAAEGFYNLTRSEQIGGTLAKILKLAWYVTPKYLTSPMEEAQATALIGEGGLPADVSAIVLPNSVGLTLWALAWLVAILALTVYLTGRKEL